MENIEWHIKNQNAKYKFDENNSKESSINISKEIFEFLGGKQTGNIITVILRKKDFLLAFSKLLSNLPLYYYRNGSQEAKFTSDFFKENYNEIEEHFGDNERISYDVKLRINNESTTRYYIYRLDDRKNFILRDFLIGENSILNFIKNDNGEIIIEPVINIIKQRNFPPFIKLPLGKIPENENALDFLAANLKEYKLKFGSYGIHYFALKYADALKTNQIKEYELCEKAKINPNYRTEIRKMKNVFDIIKQRNEIDYQSDNKINDSKNSSSSSASPSLQPPKQVIFYGVPGSGKSYSIQEQIKALEIPEQDIEECTKRVVFHPDYTNADFVGQITPAMKEEKKGGEKISVIDYAFKPGPFTQILVKAYTHKQKNYALIIEEINRGNAAAIFGELFQLLDRLNEDEKEKSNGYQYTKYWSSYPVTNDDINAAIRSAYAEHDEDFEPFIKEAAFSENTGIRLPPNLSIFATMNTSDQNVFTLDNAFKRRWNLKLIQNKFSFELKDAKQQDQNHKDQCFAKIEGFDFCWGAFVKAVNKEIASGQTEDGISSFEDRQIGVWFVKAVQDEKNPGKKIIPKETFLNKVVEYLFDDVFKLDPDGLLNLFTRASLAEIIETESNSIFTAKFAGKIAEEQTELEKTAAKSEEQKEETESA